MSQLGLFGDARAVARAPGANSPAIAQNGLVPSGPPRARTEPPATASPAPELDESFEYDDGPGTGVASYSLTLRNPHWNGRFTAGIWAHVGRHFGWKPHRWIAEVYLEFPDLERTQWSMHGIHATQDEAATEAADMVRAGWAMLEAYLRGEDVETPGRRRQRAAEVHADALPEVIEAARKVETARAARGDYDEGSSERCQAHRHYLAAKDAALGLRQRAIDAFCCAHAWQEFAADWLEAR